MYNQDTGQEFQDINSTVTLLVEALKVQDKDLVKICEQTLINLVGNEEATLILNGVISQLAGASPEYHLRTQCTVSQETKCCIALPKLDLMLLCFAVRSKNNPDLLSDSLFVLALEQIY